MARTLKSVRVRPAAPKTAHGMRTLRKVRVLSSGKK
jgi:hypothetical protein